MKSSSRGYGLGSIVQRGEVFYLRYMVAGKAKMVSLQTDDAEEAERKANAILSRSLAAAETKEEVAVHIGAAKRLMTDSKALPVADAWKTFKESPKRGDCKEVTLEWHERNWRRFEKWLKDFHSEIKMLKDVSGKLAEEYATYLWSQGVAGATYNNNFASLRTVCNCIALQAGLAEDPFKDVAKKRTAKSERLGFSLADIAKIMEVFKKPEYYVLNKEEMEVLFVIGYCTGMRLGDCCLLKWSAIDRKEGIIKTVPMKTSRIKREVKIPVLLELKAALKSAEGWKDESGYVLPKMAERYGRNVDGIVHDYCGILDEAGFKQVTENSKRENGVIVKGRGTNRRKFGFHSFRHAFASICASRGVPITTLSEILGDNVTTLQSYYLHPSEEMRSKVQTALVLPSSTPAELPAASIKATPEAKLQRIASIIQSAKQTSPELEAILAVLQS